MPDLVTTLITDDAERPNSAEKRLVAIWNSWTASCETFCSGPPTTSSLLSAPSIMTLPPRPSCPADEITTLFVLVGSKFGAGELPGTSSASSRKLRPLSGRASMALDGITASTTEPRGVDAGRRRLDVDALPHARHGQTDVDGHRLADLEHDVAVGRVAEPARRHRQVDDDGRQVRDDEGPVLAGRHDPRQPPSRAR